jgi:hypothetical protein
MNRNQKIILVIGAIVLLIALFTTPSYVLYPRDGVNVKVEANSGGGRRLIEIGYAKTVDIGNALVRAIAVVGATLLVCYALKDKKDN